MKLLRIILLSLPFFALIGCGEDEEITLNWTADAYIRAMNIDGKIHYAPVLLVESNTNVENLNVVDEKEVSYPLETYWGKQNSYRWVPLQDDFKNTIEESKTFSFSTFTAGDDKENTLTTQTALSKVPKAFEITEVAYDAKNEEFAVAWETSNAENYLITISENIDDKPIFQSFSLVSEDVSSSQIGTKFDKDTMKWFSQLQRGKTYVLCVHAFNVAGTNDIAGEFLAIKTFVFGE